MSLALASRKAALLTPWLRNPLWRSARAVPSLDLRFADNKSLADAVTGQNLITFTRASSATYVGSDGLIKTAATNEPRFNHNPTTGESLGLLVEEQRTNLLLRSEELNNVSWQKFNSGVVASVVTSNQSVAPSGVMTADKIELPAVNSAGFCSIVYQAPTQAFSTSHTFSCYLRGEVGGEKVWLEWTDNSARERTLCTLTTSWQRFSLSYTTSASGAQFVVIGVDLRDPFQTATPAQTFYAWGAQLEAGSFPTSYIPTTTAAATRSADVATDITRGAALRALYAQFRSPASGTRPVVSLDYNSANERIELFTSGTDPKLLVTDDGSTQADLDAGSITANITARLAARFNTDNFAASVSGGAEVLDATGTMPTVDRVRIGSNQAGNYLNGTIARITGWDAALPTLPSFTQ